MKVKEVDTMKGCFTVICEGLMFDSYTFAAVQSKKEVWLV